MAMQLFFQEDKFCYLAFPFYRVVKMFAEGFLCFAKPVPAALFIVECLDVSKKTPQTWGIYCHS